MIADVLVFVVLLGLALVFFFAGILVGARSEQEHQAWIRSQREDEEIQARQDGEVADEQQRRRDKIAADLAEIDALAGTGQSWRQAIAIEIRRRVSESR